MRLCSIVWLFWLRLTAIAGSCVDDNAAVTAAVGSDCATASIGGYCDTYLCPTCPYAGYCDVSCGFCSTVTEAPTRAPTTSPTPAPIPAPTSSSCADDDVAVTAAVGSDCATASARGYCDTYLCPTCPYAGYCDISCGFCSTVTKAPTRAPTTSLTPAPTSSCADYDASVEAATGFECAVQSAAGNCATHLCPTCIYAGYCDVSCGFCSTVSEAPTSAPTTSCADDNDAVVAATGFDCATASARGYCDTQLCPTCPCTGYCDVSCGFCPSPSPTSLPSSPPTLQISPSPSFAPTWTLSPTNSFVPSAAPSSTRFNVTDYDALKRAVQVDGAAIRVMNDIVYPFPRNGDDCEQDAANTTKRCYEYDSDLFDGSACWMERKGWEESGNYCDYPSALYIFGSVSISGQPDGTVLDGNAATEHFVVQPGGKLLLQSLILQNGRGTEGAFLPTYIMWFPLAGAVVVYSGGHLNATGCAFRRNGAENEGNTLLAGAVIAEGLAHFLDCTFEDNHGALAGALFAQSTYVSVSDSTFTANSNLRRATVGTAAGAVMMYSESKASFVRTTFTANRGYATHGAAGAVLMWGTTANFVDSKFIENTIVDGFVYSDDDKVDRSHYSDRASGALLLTSGAVTITSSTFIDNNNNTAAPTGAIASLGNLNIADTFFSGNRAQDHSDSCASVVYNGGALTMNRVTTVGNLPCHQPIISSLSALDITDSTFDETAADGSHCVDTCLVKYDGSNDGDLAFYLMRTWPAGKQMCSTNAVLVYNSDIPATALNPNSEAWDCDSPEIVTEGHCDEEIWCQDSNSSNANATVGIQCYCDVNGRRGDPLYPGDCVQSPFLYLPTSEFFLLADKDEEDPAQLKVLFTNQVRIGREVAWTRRMRTE